MAGSRARIFTRPTEVAIYKVSEVVDFSQVCLKTATLNKTTPLSAGEENEYPHAELELPYDVAVLVSKSTLFAYSEVNWFKI